MYSNEELVSNDDEAMRAKKESDQAKMDAVHAILTRTLDGLRVLTQEVETLNKHYSIKKCRDEQRQANGAAEEHAADLTPGMQEQMETVSKLVARMGEESKADDAWLERENRVTAASAGAHEAQAALTQDSLTTSNAKE